MVAYPLLQYPWYQRQLGPAFLPASQPLTYRAALEALVRANVEKRPIYATEVPSAFLPGYRATPVGELWRLEPP